MMEKLEICVYQMQVNRMAYVPIELEHCKNCTDKIAHGCNNYKCYTPMMQIPVRRGRFAIDYIKRCYHNYISIEGLPQEDE